MLSGLKKWEAELKSDDADAASDKPSLDGIEPRGEMMPTCARMTTDEIGQRENAQDRAADEQHSQNDHCQDKRPSDGACLLPLRRAHWCSIRNTIALHDLLLSSFLHTAPPLRDPQADLPKLSSRAIRHAAR